MTALEDRCLVDHELRGLIATGNLNGSADNIQPASYEHTFSGEIWRVDAAAETALTPDGRETIEQRLAALPAGRKRQLCMDQGIELQAGHTYLGRLRETVALPPNHYVKASPKSSIGRVFCYVRLLTDRTRCFDEIHYHHDQAPLHSWLLIQPLVYNVIVHPDLAMTQLRFFQGHDPQLSNKELAEEAVAQPYLTTADGGTVDHIVAQGLEVHLDLQGKQNQGVVALRARPNVHPIDLGEKGKLNPIDFYEPLRANGDGLAVEPGEHLLVASQEVITIPTNRSGEMHPSSHIGVQGQTHFAGFFDPGFSGTVVGELRSDENARTLRHGDPLTRFTVFRNNQPANSYGVAIGSHYKDQRGIQVPKFFAPIDYAAL